MGFIRGSALFIVIFLLFVSLFATDSLWILSSSLQHDNAKSSLSPLVEQLSNPTPGLFGVGLDAIDSNFTQLIDDSLSRLSEQCKTNQSYYFNFSGFNISMDCVTLSSGRTAVINKTINDIFEESYYKTYDCSFWQCFSLKQLPVFLVSAKARDYWHQKMLLFLGISAVLAALAFLFIERKANWPILTGVTVLLSALLAVKIKALVGFFIQKKPPILDFLLNVFLNQAEKVFIIMSVLGIVLICLGVALRIWTFGPIQKFLNKKTEKTEKKEESKTETSVSKEKKNSSTKKRR